MSRNVLRGRAPRVLVLLAAVAAGAPAGAESPLVRYGDPVPRDVREIYEAGIRYLLKTQDDSGAWRDGQSGPGVTGMAVMALLASGEDPNYGPYRVPIRKALRSMIIEQDPDTGFLGSSRGHDSMYQHGFGMLALAEAYGAVDDRSLWSEAPEVKGRGVGRSLGQALELAARYATDAARPGYFAWDPAVAPDPRSHSLMRCRARLALARQALDLRAELERAVRRP